MTSEKYVLVTGGAGYIGSNVCKMLNENGFIPVTFDNLSTGNMEHVKWGPFHFGDLRQTEDLSNIFDKYEFLGVLHFAASAYVNESMLRPLHYFDNNITSTINLLSLMKERGVRKIVFSSSCATYGLVNHNKINESTFQNPVNAYGYSKLACEKIIEFQANTGNLEYVILRYFNAAGADPELKVGELHEPETHVIPLAIQSAIANEIFSIYGSDYPTRDGTAIRDYVHVTDLSSAHLLAFNKLLNNEIKNLKCNLGSGKGFSVLEIAVAILRYFPGFKWKFEARRLGDPPELTAEIETANSILDWKPVNSDLESIIISAINWEQSKVKLLQQDISKEKFDL